jgi:hypothetical protein
MIQETLHGPNRSYNIKHQEKKHSARVQKLGYIKRHTLYVKISIPQHIALSVQKNDDRIALVWQFLLYWVFLAHTPDPYLSVLVWAALKGSALPWRPYPKPPCG